MFSNLFLETYYFFSAEQDVSDLHTWTVRNKTLTSVSSKIYSSIVNNPKPMKLRQVSSALK